MSKWSREQIIRTILEREKSGLPLNLGREHGVESRLYQAASRIFGTWRNAIMAAGIDVRHAQVTERWDPSKVLHAIRALSRRKRPLRPDELKVKYGKLMREGRRHFGSWPKAVVAAGVDPLRLRRIPLWTRERIVEAILTRALRNEPLGSRAVIPRSLADAGTRIFGTWGLALTAAGLNPRRYGCRAPAVGSAAADQNRLPAPGHVEECAFKGSGQTRPNVVKLDSLKNPSKSWSDERIVHSILARLDDHRKLNALAIYRDDTRLYRAALRRYGNWCSALQAAGLNPDDYCIFRGRFTGSLD